MQTNRNSFDDALAILTSTENQFEDFWVSYNLVKKTAMRHYMLDQNVRDQLTVIRKCVIDNHDTGQGSFLLGRLASELSDILRSKLP